MRPKMALNDDGSSITVSGTKAVTGLVEIGNTIFPSECVCVLLNPTRTLPGLRRLSGL